MKFGYILNIMRENIYQLKSVKIQQPIAPGSEAYAGDVWTIHDIALYLRSSELSASRRVNQEGFPRPLGNLQRNRRWLAKDVKEFFEKLSKTPYVFRPELQVESSYEPSTIIFRD